MDDPATVGIPPELAASIETLLEAHGDEAYRQIALFCIGKWHKIHCEVLQQHIENDGISEMLMVMSDISKLSTVLMVLEQVGSFGGDDDWRKCYALLLVSQSWKLLKRKASPSTPSSIQTDD